MISEAGATPASLARVDPEDSLSHQPSPTPHDVLGKSHFGDSSSDKPQAGQGGQNEEALHSPGWDRRKEAHVKAFLGRPGRDRTGGLHWFSHRPFYMGNVISSEGLAPSSAHYCNAGKSESGDSHVLRTPPPGSTTPPPRHVSICFKLLFHLDLCNWESREKTNFFQKRYLETVQ